MSIHEPVTFATDCLLAALSGWFAWRLRRQTPDANRAARWWSGTLGLTAASALAGGCHHGFAPDFPVPLADWWWKATLLIICAASATMAMSLLHEIAPAGRRGPWLGLVGLKFVAFAAVALIHPVFVVAILDYGLAMVAWLVAAVILQRAWRGWMLAGIALSVVAALAQQLHWSLAPQFNHNDLYHVVQAMALFGFYRAGLGFSGQTREGALRMPRPAF